MHNEIRKIKRRSFHISAFKQTSYSKKKSNIGVKEILWNIQ